MSAKLKCATITANTDGPTALTLLQLRPKSTVTDNGTTVATVPASGSATVNLADRHELSADVLREYQLTRLWS